MENKTKSVSVVICTYNGEKYLKEQLDSIFNQTYPIAEVIAQDDESSDKTLEILNDYAQKHPEMKVFVNKDHALGLNSNFFNAFRKCTGDYIAISDQDDIWELDKIENQMRDIGDNFLSTGISYNFASDDSYCFNDNRTPNYHLMHLLFLVLRVTQSL